MPNQQTYTYEPHHVCRTVFVNGIPYRVIEHRNEVDQDGNPLPYGALVRTGETAIGKFQTVIVKGGK